MSSEDQYTRRQIIGLVTCCYALTWVAVGVFLGIAGKLSASLAIMTAAAICLAAGWSMSEDRVANEWVAAVIILHLLPFVLLFIA
ncbi:MAG: hypothetical protein HYV07_01425 [Deltaproteobacteria bacterium]|nr:hypothetical protein [Deltaproteobacteria bacterium]